MDEKKSKPKVKSTSWGELKINGKLVKVALVMENGELIINVPEGTDMSNWSHAVIISTADEAYCNGLSTEN